MTREGGASENRLMAAESHIHVPCQGRPVNDLSSARLGDSRTHDHELRSVNIPCVTSHHAAILIELYREALVQLACSTHA